MILGYLSYVDLQKREVPDLPVLALFLYSLFIVPDLKASFIIGGTVFLFQFLLTVITDGGIGGGDIKLLSVLAFVMEEDFFLVTLFMAAMMIIVFIYSLLNGKGLKFAVPLVPFIFISYISYLIAWGCNQWIPLNILYY